MSQKPNPPDAIRAQLQRRASALRQEIAAAERVIDVSGTEVIDRKEVAGERIQSELADAETRRDRDELALVEAALRRLESGHYGECLECGESIPASRLAAQPAALRCMACQERLERAPGTAPPRS